MTAGPVRELFQTSSSTRQRQNHHQTTTKETEDVVVLEATRKPQQQREEESDEKAPPPVTATSPPPPYKPINTSEVMILNDRSILEGNGEEEEEEESDANEEDIEEEENVGREVEDEDEDLFMVTSSTVILETKGPDEETNIRWQKKENKTRVSLEDLLHTPIAFCFLLSGPSTESPSTSRTIPSTLTTPNWNVGCGSVLKGSQTGTRRSYKSPR